MRAALVAVVLLFLVGCQTTPTPTLFTQCAAERPQVCTMEYNPVCANVQSGGQKTYSSPCNACADDAVLEYLAGACPE